MISIANKITELGSFPHIWRIGWEFNGFFLLLKIEYCREKRLGQVNYNH